MPLVPSSPVTLAGARRRRRVVLALLDKSLRPAAAARRDRGRCGARVRTRQMARARALTLARLPCDVLRTVAGILGHSSFVVALASTDLSAARRACRDAVDALERARFPGAPLTVREAEYTLRYEVVVTRAGRSPDEVLATRETAGRYLFDLMDGRGGGAEADMDGLFSSNLFATILAYGADAKVHSDRGDFRYGMLHLLASEGPVHAIEMATQLLAAGADIDMRCMEDNSAGRSALSWAVTVEGQRQESPEGVTRILRLACFLIDQGANVVQSSNDFRDSPGGLGDLEESDGEERMSLVDFLDQQDWGNWEFGDAALTAAASALRTKLVAALDA